MQIAVDALLAQIAKNEAEISNCKAALSALGAKTPAIEEPKPRNGKPGRKPAEKVPAGEPVAKPVKKISQKGVVKADGPSPCEKVTDELKVKVLGELGVVGYGETSIRGRVGCDNRLTNVLKALEADGKAKRVGKGVGTLWMKA